MLCILTSERMLAHAFAWSKTIKNFQKPQKSTFFIIRPSGLCNAHEEKRRKKMIFECFQSFLTMRMHAFAGQNTQHRKHYTPKIINAFTITQIPCFWPKQKKTAFNNQLLSITQNANYNEKFFSQKLNLFLLKYL